MKIYEQCPREGFELFIQSAAIKPISILSKVNILPSESPPAYVPNPVLSTKMKDVPSIHHLSAKHCYLWLNNRQQFWFFPTLIEKEAISGFRWLNREWVYTSFEVGLIDGFYANF